MDWETLRKSTAEYFSAGDLVRGLSPDEVLNPSPDLKTLYLSTLDWAWGSDDEVGQKLSNVKADYLDRCNQVEILLSEAGMLIQRSLTDHMKFDELSVERFKLWMEFVEFGKTQDQQIIEQNDEPYWKGLISEQQLSSQARTAASGNIDLTNKYYDQVVMWHQNAANNFNSAHNTGASNEADAELVAMESAKAQYAAQVAANDLDSQSRIARMKYETQDRVHQVERQQIAQYIIGLKISEFQKPGGAINYNDRMRVIGKRSLADYLEVHARLYAIMSGLREFYSVTDPSEAELDDVNLQNWRTRIDGAVAWLRKAANALSRAKMDEEETIVRITIEQEPPTLIQQLRAGLAISFREAWIANMARAHLRGLSATVESDGDSWLDLEVTSPTQKLITVDITLPAVTTRLGRASSAASLNVRDVAGTRPIINRSPVGDWTIRSLRDFKGESAKRVDLDFHLAYVRA